MRGQEFWDRWDRGLKSNFGRTNSQWLEVRDILCITTIKQLDISCLVQCNALSYFATFGRIRKEKVKE